MERFLLRIAIAIAKYRKQLWIDRMVDAVLDGHPPEEVSMYQNKISGIDNQLATYQAELEGVRNGF
jgi:hypothetical protein